MKDGIFDIIGNTPLVRLSRLKEALGVSANIFGKVEGLNPAGSAKDRVALRMILDAEEKGLLKEGATIIEPTSGNTGIGLAALAAARGYQAVFTMPETMSKERQMLLRAYGAKVILTEGNKGMAGAIEKANELSKEISGSFLAGQFENPSNAKAHYLTTGPEIWEDAEGKVDMLIACVGTGGTITGTGAFLRQKNPAIKIVAVEPKKSAVLSGKEPSSHKIQGIGAGFIPKVLNTDIYDEIYTATEEESFEVARKIATLEGILVGISSGAALAAAAFYGKMEQYANKSIVVILPDSGERYLSTELFQEGGV